MRPVCCCLHQKGVGQTLYFCLCRAGFNSSSYWRRKVVLPSECRVHCVPRKELWTPSLLILLFWFCPSVSCFVSSYSSVSVCICRYWLTNNVHIKRPTTGLLMYTMATRFCEEIHLYGFWPFSLDPQGKPVKYHYYDTLKYEYTSSSSPHTMPLEFRTLSTLHRQGALRLHTGVCGIQQRPQKDLQSK